MEKERFKSNVVNLLNLWVPGTHMLAIGKGCYISSVTLINRRYNLPNCTNLLPRDYISLRQEKQNTKARCEQVFIHRCYNFICKNCLKCEIKSSLKQISLTR